MFRRASAPLSGARSKSTVFDQDAFSSTSGSSALAPDTQTQVDPLALAPSDYKDYKDYRALPRSTDTLIDIGGPGGRGRDALLNLVDVEDELDLLGISSKTIYVNSVGPISIDAVLLPPGQQLQFLGTLDREPRWSSTDAAEVSEAVDGWVEMLWQNLCDHEPVNSSTVETWVSYYKSSPSVAYQLRVEIELNEWTGFNRFCSEFAAAIHDKTAGERPVAIFEPLEASSGMQFPNWMTD